MNENNAEENNKVGGDQEQEKEELEDLKRIDTSSVRTNKLDIQIKTLIDDFKNGEIYVPDYQRNFVWKDTISSKLVESILLGFPIPPIFLSEDSDGRRQIIDGQQRIRSLEKFYDNLLPLKLGRKNKLTGTNFKGLNKELRRTFSNNFLRAITLLKDSDPVVKYEMFERLNRGSVKLKDQEIRNCVYRGIYMNSIKKMAKLSDFKEAVNYKPFIKRMDMEDLVTRFGALIHNDYHTAYKGSSKNFLQKEMELHLNPNDDFIRDFEEKFKKCAYLTFSTFGNNAFKRYIISKDGNSARWDKKPNKALFEAVMYSFARYDKNQIMKHKDQILEGLIMLMTLNETFNDLISHHTNATDRFLKRMKIWIDELDLIITTPKQPRCFSYKIKRDLFYENDICAICEKQIINIKDAAVDHIEPYWRGGLTIQDNAQLVHRWCNLKKSGN